VIPFTSVKPILSLSFLATPTWQTVIEFLDRYMKR